MWSGCHPKDDDDLHECMQLGKNLSRMSQPTILSILQEAGKPLHGYKIVQIAAGTPMFGGSKPDAAGIYRALKKMEEQGLVTASWDTPDSGAAKRMFSLTEEGQNCLRRWVDALACYCVTIQELRQMAANALGIELPDTPDCRH